MNSTRPLSCHSKYRIMLLKVGFTDKEIEQIYILENNIEVAGVNWCNCRRCKSHATFSLGNWGYSDGDVRQKFHVDEKHTSSDMENVIFQAEISRKRGVIKMLMALCIAVEFHDD